MTNPLASIVIVTWNAEGDIEETLDSIYEQDYTNFEVIVIDSASSDSTVEVIRTKYPQVRLTVAEENVGYRRGNQMGMLLAKGDYIVACNDDVRVEKHWLGGLVNVMVEDPSIGMATPLILDHTKPETISAAGNTLIYIGMAAHSQYRGESREFGLALDPELAAVSGCSFIIPKSIFETTGGFSNDFNQFDSGWHAGCEVADLAWRVQLLGKSIKLVPDSILYHKHNWKKLHAERFIAHEWGRYLLLFRNYELKTLVMLSPILIVLELMSCVFCLIRGRRWIKLKRAQWRWLFANTKSLKSMRSNVQRNRSVEDMSIIRKMDPTISVAYSLGFGRIGDVLNAALNMLFTGYYRFICFVLPRI